MSRPRMRASDVLRRLEGRHGDDHAWVHLTEWERIDFLALACHAVPDRRRERRPMNAIYPWVAYEVKVSRQDFLNEIRRPHKRLLAVALANEFYFAAPAGLIKPGEVPPDCGLVEVTAGGTRTVIESPITRREPITPLQVAQMLRHGMNPAWLRSWQFRRATMKWREQAAREAEKRAEKTVALAQSILTLELARALEVGQHFRPRDTWTRRALEDEVEIVEVTPTTVKVRYCNERRFAYEPRYEIGEFLLAHERA